jgi:hypothetical protein
MPYTFKCQYRGCFMEFPSETHRDFHRRTHRHCSLPNGDIVNCCGNGYFHCPENGCSFQTYYGSSLRRHFQSQHCEQYPIPNYFQPSPNYSQTIPNYFPMGNLNMNQVEKMDVFLMLSNGVNLSMHFSRRNNSVSPDAVSSFL